MVNAAYQLLAYNCAASIESVLTAQDLLAQRCANLKALKAKNGMACPAVTLAEVMATHTVWVANTFKPYVQLAFTYATYTPYGGTCEYGGETDLRIRIEGDFFADAAWDVTTSGATTTAGGLTDLQTGGAAGNSNANYATVSALVPDAFNPSGITNVNTIYEYVDSNGIAIADVNGAVTAAGTALGYANNTSGVVAASNWIRHVEFPGLALMLDAQFKVQQNDIDKYDRECNLVYNKIGVPSDKRASFNRLVGQDNPIEGRSLHSLGAAHATGLLTGPSTTTALGFVQENDCSYAHQLHGAALTGNQTPKASQAAIQMLIPFIFEWCMSKSSAIPSVSIPDSDRDICVHVAPIGDIYKVAPGPLRIRETIIYNSPAYMVVREHPFLISGSTVSALNNGKLTSSILVNNIFVAQCLHDIFLLRIGFVKYSCFRHMKATLTSSEEVKRLSTLKFAVTEVYLFVRPKVNTTTHREVWQTWHLGAWADTRTSWHDCPILMGVPAAQPSGAPQFLSGQTASPGYVVAGRYQDKALRFVKCFNTVQNATFSIQSIDYYEKRANIFYNSYLTYAYGGPRVVAPKECDIIAFYWALHPGLQAPSGNYNASRAREADVTLEAGTDCDGNYTVSNSREAIMYMCAKAINFLLFSECSMVKHFV